jgi:phosphoadenosine phosphosulfate reductase
MILRSLACRDAQGRANGTNGPDFPRDLASSRLESRRVVKANSVLQLVIEDLYPGRVALVSSFGTDAAVLLHMVSQIDQATPVIFVDTGRHFPETLAYRNKLCAILGLTNVIIAEPKAETIAKEDPEKLLFMRDPDRCCEFRKVRPLAAALGVYDAWIAGRKGFQTADRSGLPLFEAEGKRVKVNPLIGWSASDVLAYIAEAGLTRHPLVAKGFPSIGCLPCTSRVWPGEDARAGRWRGRTKIECGIHTAALVAEADIVEVGVPQRGRAVPCGAQPRPSRSLLSD